MLAMLTTQCTYNVFYAVIVMVRANPNLAYDYAAQKAHYNALLVCSSCIIDRSFKKSVTKVLRNLNGIRIFCQIQLCYELGNDYIDLFRYILSFGLVIALKLLKMFTAAVQLSRDTVLLDYEIMHS